MAEGPPALVEVKEYPETTLKCQRDVRTYIRQRPLDVAEVKASEERTRATVTLPNAFLIRRLISHAQNGKVDGGGFVVAAERGRVLH